MATPKLTEIQKELNQVVKKRYPKFKSFTYYDFADGNSDASNLLQLFEEYKKDKSLIFEIHKKIEQYLDKAHPESKTFNLQNEIVKMIDNIDSIHKNNLFITSYKMLLDKKSPKAYLDEPVYNIENFKKLILTSSDESTLTSIHNIFKKFTIDLKTERQHGALAQIQKVKDLFGINQDTLAKEIYHPSYDNKKKFDVYEEQITEWIAYCQFITRFINYIKDNYPRWDKMTKKEKKNNITITDLVENKMIDKNYYDYIPNFIKYYGLNSRNKAHADKLLEYKMPNITKEIALKISIHSSKNKKS